MLCIALKELEEEVKSLHANVRQCVVREDLHVSVRHDGSISTYFDDLKNVEEPLLEVVLESVHQKVTIGEAWVSDQRLICKVANTSVIVLQSDLN